MPNVNVERARQLVRACALAYESGIDAVKASPHFAGSRLIDNPWLQQFTIGIDSVLIGQTDFGVVVAFRGTLSPTDTDPVEAIKVALGWLNDGDLMLQGVPYAAGKVHYGFRKSLDNLWDNSGLFAKVQSAAQGGRRVFLTGHSKGGALATLAARRFKAAGVTPAGVMTFGASRTGDQKFAAAYDSEVPNHWRFEHQDDVVPHLPPRPAVMHALRTLISFGNLSTLLGSNITKPFGHYQPVGHRRFLDWNDQLGEGDSFWLELEREARLIRAGKELLTDHFLNATPPSAGKSSYVETVDRI
jgi:hypothetical protein